MSVYTPGSDVDSADMLITAQNLANALGWVSPSSGDLAKATTAVMGATSILQTLCSPSSTQPRRLVHVTSDVITLDGNGAEEFLLPDWPVTAVTLITEDGTDLGASDYEWSASSGRVRRLTSATTQPVTWPRWTCRLGGLVVTYSHGYALVPEALAAVCRSLAARLLAEPDGREVRLEALGSYSVGYQGKGTIGLTALEAATIARYSSGR